MDIQHIFTTPIVVDHLSVDNNKLEAFCRATISSAIGHPNQSGALNLDHPEIQPLLQEILIRLSELHTSLNFKIDTEFKITKAWANLNNSAPVDLPHCHPASVFSAVYYVKGSGTPENGNIVMLSPLAPTIQYVIPEECKEVNNLFNAWHCTIPPETSKLIIFPSWIIHSVSPNLLPHSDRISIAFDAILAKK